MADHRDAARVRIDLKQEGECRYWSRTLGVRPKELKAIVRLVGDRAEAVREYLQRSSPGVGTTGS